MNTPTRILLSRGHHAFAAASALYPRNAALRHPIFILRQCSAQFVYRLAQLAVLLALFAVPGGYACAGDAPAIQDASFLQPDPKFTPADVVRIQLQALQANDTPHKDAGIEVAFRFASPANKSTTGPLPRFINLVNSSPYRAMLNHRKAHFGQIEIEGNKAVQPVILVTPNGERAGYLFSLTRQLTGRYASCWMTDAVIRFEIIGGKERVL